MLRSIIKREEKNNKKKRILGLGEILLIVCIPLTAFLYAYPILPLSFIFAFLLVQTSKLTNYVINKPYTEEKNQEEDEEWI